MSPVLSPGRSTIATDRPCDRRASASTSSAVVPPLNPGTSSTGPWLSWDTGRTASSRLARTAAPTPTAATQREHGEADHDPPRAGESLEHLPILALTS